MAITTLGNKAVGDIIKIKVNGTARDFIVVHQGKPSALYNESCDGTWLLMKDIYENMGWDSNDNDYRNSDINAYLNSTFLDLFDSNTKAAIKHAAIPYVIGTGSSGSVISGTSGLYSKIFLLSGYEVGWTESDNEYFPIDGAKLSYFSSGQGSAANNKRIANYNGKAASWWLRSPSIDNDNDVWYVLASGSSRNYGSNPSGVRPALIMPTTQKVDSDGNIVFNTEPTITGSKTSGSSMGTISAPFSFTYTVRDADNDTVTVKEYLDNVLQRSYTVTLGVTNTFQAASNSAMFQKILNGLHTIKVIATDSAGNSSAAYTVTFNKQVKTATITLTTPLPADDVIKAAVVTVTGSIPQDATLKVLVTNNAKDTSPVWEDMSQDVKQGVNHLFTNKTAAKGFAFNFKVTVTRGASGTEGYISGIGGAFE